MKLSTLLFTLGAILLSPSRSFAGIYITAGTDVSTRSYIQFYVEDEFGRRTGQPSTGPEVAEIPGTEGHYGTESIFREDTGESGPESVEFQTSSFPAGRFRLVLLPEITTSYWLRVSFVNDNDKSLHQKFFGYATAASSVAFIFEHAPTNANPTPITKNVTIGELRQSVQVAFQLGHLGDTKFVAKLDKILAEGEKALSKKGGKEKDRENRKKAIEKLREFIKKLEKAAKGEKDDDDKHEKPEHRHGKDEKRFVSAQALASLREDALTLIAQLQPRDHHDDDKKHDHDDHDKKGDDR